MRAAVREAAPAVVFHLAALASVGRSWEAPAETLTENVAMTAHVLEAVRLEAPEAAVVVVGSGEVYGPPARLPVDEDAPLRPQNPYAVSKAACDLLAGQYADAFGMRVVRMRPFNHAGPGQSDDYVVGTLTRQVAEAEAAGREEAVLRTGNPDSARDFTDVRDVVRAYVAAAALHAGALQRGERPCRQRARPDRARARRGPACPCGTRSTRAGCAPTTCRRSAARPSACGRRPGGVRRSPWSGPWRTRSTIGASGFAVSGARVAGRGGGSCAYAPGDARSISIPITPATRPMSAS